MGTNIYMRKIPRRERQKELMELISKQCQQRIDSIKKDAGRCPGESDRSLDEDIDSLRQQIYEDYTFVGKVMSLLFNTLFRFVIASFQRASVF